MNKVRLTEKRLLQAAIAIGGLVPLTAGAIGVLDPGVLGIYGDNGAIAHAAYLSGLLLGIGLSYWSLIPDIEKRGAAFTMLTVIVLAGGLARLAMVFRLGDWTLDIGLPLLMELTVTPLLWLWQMRVGASQSANK